MMKVTLIKLFLDISELKPQVSYGTNAMTLAIDELFQPLKVQKMKEHISIWI